uniref:Glycoside hydrolase family 16 protein n=1 Tax=Mycena chlorophos TaxID=658473 RepID=A0ABQ0LB85_MYCCL|nr:glycoside hydrolase family 16 protein [Mycena chlorophos]
MKATVLIATISLAATVLAGQYSRTQNIVGAGFFNAFEFQAIPDPTHGRVNYVDMPTAQARNLAYAAGDTFFLHADATTVIPDGSPQGRNSFRLMSRASYANHAAIFDIQHMPQGCGTWPAVWETGDTPWPACGEVDILEGVNGQGTNTISLHTNPGCTMPAIRTQTGTSLQLDCDAEAEGNAGCGVLAPFATSFGPTFNGYGGGWYAIERTDAFINIWFWSRVNGGVPADVYAGGGTVNTSTWGTPTASFPSTSCNIPQFFSRHNIIINLTLCGDWAGAPSVLAAAGCPVNCNNFVDANPGAFVDAYFAFNSINVYE